jgi:hypothetical protein
MVEFTPVAFSFNQDEYIVSVILGRSDRAFSLPDIPDTVVEVILNENHGIKTIRAYDAVEAQTRFKEIVEAKKLKKGEFTPGVPAYNVYELRLKDGKLVSAELKLESYGEQYWQQLYVNKRIEQKDVVGWRIIKTHPQKW